MKSAVFFLGLTMGGTALAGHIDGNGTAGLVNPGSWNWTRIYDLWEGENQEFLLHESPKLTYSAAPNSGTAYALSRIARHAPQFARRIEICLPYLRKTASYLPDGLRFSPPGDIDPTFLPVGYDLVRIAAMDDSFKVMIDRQLFEKMNALDQEMLFFHEIVYHEQRVNLRITGTSQWARKVVACAFSDNCPEDMLRHRVASIESRYPSFNPCKAN